MEFGGSQNDLLFSTKERDFSTGLDYFGFRYYDAVLGKFTTRDPSGYPDGPNNYLYCGNNPINCIDPMGLATVRDYERRIQKLQENLKEDLPQIQKQLDSDDKKVRAKGEANLNWYLNEMSRYALKIAKIKAVHSYIQSLDDRSSIRFMRGLTKLIGGDEAGEYWSMMRNYSIDKLDDETLKYDIVKNLMSADKIAQVGANVLGFFTGAGLVMKGVQIVKKGGVLLKVGQMQLAGSTMTVPVIISADGTIKLATAIGLGSTGLTAQLATANNISKMADDSNNTYGPNGYRGGGQFLEKGTQLQDKISNVDLFKKSLSKGQKLLEKLGLVKRIEKSGRVSFVDSKGVVRAAYDKATKKWPAHWHKFFRDSHGHIYELSNKGKVIAKNMSNAVEKVHIKAAK